MNSRTPDDDSTGELERSIREHRVAVTNLRQQQIEILERLDGRIAQLQSRTNHLNHVVIVIRAISPGGASLEGQVAVAVPMDHTNAYADEYHCWIAEFEKRDPGLIRMKVGCSSASRW